MNVHVDVELLYRLLISFGIGTAIGLEREYRSKAAGLRTMIMICFGSTIFTQISIELGGTGSPDRIAAAIVSGIGFLGAGVIFKDGLSISGITTATTIWISAALGMAVGAGEYFIALIGGAVVLIVLVLFEKLQNKFEKFHQIRTYRITYSGKKSFQDSLSNEIRSHQLNFIVKRDLKTDRGFVIIYEIFGKEVRLNKVNEFIKENPEVHSFEY